MWPCLLGAQALGAVPGGEGELPVGGMGEAWLKMFGTLVLVVGLIVLLFYLVKRFRLGPFQGGKDVRLRLLGTLHLAPKRLIAVVEVCGQWLVLGVGSESISLLSKLDGPELTEGFSAPVPPDRPSFEGILQNRLFGGRGSRRGKSHEGA